jgi:hypothetical protein
LVERTIVQMRHTLCGAAALFSMLGAACSSSKTAAGDGASVSTAAGAGATATATASTTKPTASPPTSAAATSAAATTTSAAQPAATATAGAPAEPAFEPFDVGSFDPARSAIIDNAWYPLLAGTRWTYEGSALDQGEKVSRHLEFTVTNLTKEIAGVRTAVAYIVDTDDGVVVEKEIAFYAQDTKGNVWYFGEHPEDYDNGRFVEAPTWIAGYADAKPGIKMRPEPSLGSPSYYQGWGPAVDWTDYARIDQVGAKTCVPFGCYENVTVIAESSLAERGIFQVKDYARGVGELRVGWRGPDPSQEQLELVGFSKLDDAALAKARADALDLEKHAYVVSKNLYGRTTPAQ